MNMKQIIKHSRELARNANLTFKVDDSCRINGSTAYKVVDRESGLVHKNWSSMSLHSAYDALCAMR